MITPEVVGALAALGGVLLGRILPDRRPEPPAPPKPVCGCKHHHSFHDPQTGECHGMMKGKEIEFDKYQSRTAVGWERIPCTCRQYSGPVPLPEFSVHEIAGGS